MNNDFPESSDLNSDDQPVRRIFRGKEQWRSLVTEFESSNLSQAEFCKIHGIATSGLYKWRKHFSESSDNDNFMNITNSLPPEISPSAVQSTDRHWQVELEVGGIILRLRS